MSLVEESKSAMVQTNSSDLVDPTIPCSVDGEEEIKVYEYRLGRILTDDNEHIHSKCSPTLETREEGVSREELLKAIGVLNRLASMDSSEYERKLKASCLPSFHEPPLCILSQSIHRFHSVVTNLTREYDAQTIEIVDLQKELEKSRSRIFKLETAVTRLHSRNTKLRSQSKADQNLSRKLFQQVQTFSMNAAKRKDEEEFYKLADKVQQHEQALRERSDSNFSDIDGLSVESCMSGQSIVTDTGIATVRIQVQGENRQRSSTWHSGIFSEVENIEIIPESQRKSRSQDITEGKKVPVIPSRKRIGTNPMDSSQNPFAMFLTPKPAQPYRLSFEAPFRLQFVELDVTASNGQEEPLSTDSAIRPPSISQTAFAVCGYKEFDSNLNVKPTLGARLLDINKKPIDDNWSLQDLMEAVDAAGDTCTMLFRNDTWNKEQKERIHNLHDQMHPQAFQEMTPFLRNRSQSGDSSRQKNNLLSFWNYNPPSPKIKELEPNDVVQEDGSEESEDEPSQGKKNLPLNTTMSIFFKISPSKPNFLSTDGGSHVDMNLPKKFENPRRESEHNLDGEIKQRYAEVAKQASFPANETSLSTRHSNECSKTAESVASETREEAKDPFTSSVMNMSKLFAFR